MPRQSGLLLFVFLLAILSTACVQDSPEPPPAAVSVAATPTPDPSGTTVPQETAVEPVAATPEAQLSVQEYAASCEELNYTFPRASFDEFIATKGKSEEARTSFTAWITMWSALRPPPELADYHDAKTSQFLSEIQHGGFNQAAHESRIREAKAVDAMSPEVQAILFQESCLIQLDYIIGQRLLEGLRRAESRGPAPNPPTVTDYAGRCGDVRMTIPIMGGRDGIAGHLANGMDALSPPPELQQFHDHLVSTLRLWADEEQNASLTFGPVLKLATTGAANLPPYLFDILVSSGCVFVSSTASPPATPIPSATSTQASLLLAQEYAASCGELVALQKEVYGQFREAGETGGEERWRWYTNWGYMFLRLKPPPETCRLSRGQDDLLLV